MDLMTGAKLGALFLSSFYFFTLYQILTEKTGDFCDCHGKEFCYRPLAKIKNQTFYLKGLAFKCQLERYVQEIEDIEEPKNFNNTLDALKQLTIVTYASADHFYEAKMMLYLWRYKYPNIPILFYSLELTVNQRKELSRICGVTLREFDFSKYPSHVKNLRNYAFKMAILREVYMDLDFYYLMDSSLRPFNSTAFAEYINASYTGKIAPFSLTHLTPQSNTMLTHFGIYGYLPIQKELNDRIQFAGGSILVKKGRFSSEIIKWATLCAMTEECISPIGSFGECDFRKGIITCHRYDQSMMNILLYNALQEYQDWDSMVLDWPYDNAEAVRRENDWSLTLPEEILCK